MNEEAGQEFAEWCVDLLTKAESEGRRLDEDKKQILGRAYDLINSITDEVP